MTLFGETVKKQITAESYKSHEKRKQKIRQWSRTQRVLKKKKKVNIKLQASKRNPCHLERPGHDIQSRGVGLPWTFLGGRNVRKKKPTPGVGVQESTEMFNKSNLAFLHH